jgi:YidC/Oxa1 family membrane protein insertase
MDIWNALIINPFTNMLLLIYAFVGNFGLSIILFTILIRLLTHPFMAAQIKSSTAMQALTQSDEWKKMQEKYKGDQEKIGQETMRLYKEHGVNPFASCLPMLLQLPIMLGFYQSIVHAIGATPMQLLGVVRSIYPWMEKITPAASLSALIPIHSHFLWMDLGQPERVFLGSLLAFLGIPAFGIPVLAIIVGITTFLQTKLTMPAASGAGATDQSAQMTQSMSFMMPVMLFMFTINYASGLAVYLITSNVIGILQYAALGKINWSGLLPTKKQEAVVAPTKTPVKKKTAKRS